MVKVTNCWVFCASTPSLMGANANGTCGGGGQLARVKFQSAMVMSVHLRYQIPGL